MAVVTKSIQAGGGGDYTTIAAWEAATNLNSGADIWKGEIDDNSEYNESITINGGGTGSSSYVWLTGGASNRHSGVAGTGHPRIRASDGNHAITVSSDWVRIEWLEIQQDGSGSSDEGIRITEVDDVLISHCIIWSDNATADQDGVYAAGVNMTVSIDNCILYGWHRAAIHPQNLQSGKTQTWDVDHCTTFDNGAAAENESGGIHINAASGATVTVNVYNTIGAETQSTYDDFSESGLGTKNWAGSHNLYTQGDQSGLSNLQNASDGAVDTTQSSGSYVVFSDLTGGSEDLTLLDDAAGNLAAGNGTNRQGSEPDSRQDFSVDITGGSRPTSGVDIGAHQVTAGGTPGSASPGVIALSATMPAASPAGAGNASPGAISAPVTIPTPSYAAPRTVEPGAIATSATIPQPVARGGTGVDAPEIATSATLPQPSPSGGGVASPGSIDLSVSLPAVTIDIGGSPATVTPGVIALSVGVEQVTTVGAAVVSPGSTDLTVTIPAVSVASPASPSPSPINLSFTIPTATVTGGGVATPGTIALEVTLPTPLVFSGTIIHVPGKTSVDVNAQAANIDITKSLTTVTVNNPITWPSLDDDNDTEA